MASENGSGNRHVFGIEFENKITLTQFLFVAGQGIFLLWLAFGYVFRGDQAVTDFNNYKTANDATIKTLRADLSQQSANLRSEMLDKISAIQADRLLKYQAMQTTIANIPDMRAELSQLEKRSDQADSRADAQSKRMETIQSGQIQNGSDISAILRALSGTPRNGGPH